MTTLVTSFLDRSSFLQVTRPTTKARMGLNFGKVPSLTSELAALDSITDFRVSCPRASDKSMNNVVTMLWTSLNFVKIPSPIIE